MDELLRQPDLECPNCRRAYSVGRRPQCPTCLVPLVYLSSSDPMAPAAGSIYRPVPRRPHLDWLARANDLNKVWLAISLLYALGHLTLLRGVNVVLILSFLVPPLLAFAVLVSAKTSPRIRRLAWTYLAAVVVGDVLAHFPQVFPGMNWFRQLPLAESRLLTWQMALNCMYVSLVLPPVFFGSRLQVAIRRRRVGLGVFVILFGYSVWIVLFPIIALGLLWGFGFV